MTMNVDLCKGAYSDPGSIPGVSTNQLKSHMFDLILILILGIIVYYLIHLSKKQRRKARSTRERIVRRAWHMDE